MDGMLDLESPMRCLTRTLLAVLLAEALLLGYLLRLTLRYPLQEAAEGGSICSTSV